MGLLDAVILGLVQGVTEFIPISSSGHLILIDKLINSGSTFDFDAILNVGTLAALLIYFRTRLWSIVLSLIEKNDWHLVINIIISTIPAAAIGYLASDYLAKGSLRSVWVVATMLMIGGLFMIFESRLKPQKVSNIDNLTKCKALGIGFVQVLALIPGTSRSGSTILAGRFSGLDHEAAAEYSFLIAIPILFGAILKTIIGTHVSDLFNSSEMWVIIVGITTSFISGYIAISAMMKYLRKHNLQVFGYYRIAVAVLLLITLV